MRPDRHSGALAGIAMVVTATACFGVLDTITDTVTMLTNVPMLAFTGFLLVLFFTRKLR